MLLTFHENKYRIIDKVALNKIHQMEAEYGSGKEKESE